MMLPPIGLDLFSVHNIQDNMEIHNREACLQFCFYCYVISPDVVSACKLRGTEEDAQSHVIRRSGKSGLNAQEFTRWKVCSS